MSGETNRKRGSSAARCGISFGENAYSQALFSKSDESNIMNRPLRNLTLLTHAPFCQVMAGRGAPEVSQCRMTDMPSITVLSEGPAVIFGAMPEGRQNTQNEERELSLVKRGGKRVIEVRERLSVANVCFGEGV